jgi:ABC-2 type transport system ATP-binding protein
MNGNIVEIENIHYSYDRKKTVLTDFSLEIKSDIILAILGHNGAGKTTLLRLLGKLIKPNQGNIQWNLSTNERIGYMPEGLGLYPRLSGYQNMRLQFLSSDRNADNELILSIINKIGLEEHAKKLVGYYSTGMKRRLSLACALVTTPQLLLMDEPFMGIDPVSQKIMVDLIHEYKKQNSTIIITTHDLNMVKNICNSFVIIQNGKAVYTSDENEDINNIEGVYFQYAGK